jgi:CheY-like chemotaxis protein
MRLSNHTRNTETLLVELNKTPTCSHELDDFAPNALASILQLVNKAGWNHFCGALALMTGKILIVEDDAITRRNLSLLLSDEGYDVDQATDGVHALEKLAGRPFDLVLSDIVMPRMDGLKLLQQLQFRAPQIPVMIMTSYVSDSLSTVPAGATEFIRKPFVLDDLLFKVQRALDKTVQSAGH